MASNVVFSYALCAQMIFLTFLVFAITTYAGSHPSNHASSHYKRTTTYNTSLIQNITRQLNTILLNQDKNFRPLNADPRSPLQVEVDISVRSMGPISEQDMEFSLDCYFRQKWTDRRLAFSPIGSRQDLPLASKMLKDIWVPDTYIRNGRRSYLHTLTVPNVLFRVRSDGQVHVSQRLTIKTRCKMFFKKFPMDSQACPIEIGSLGHFTRDIVYVWKDVDLDSKMGNMLSQYQLLDVVKTQYNQTDPRDSNSSASVLKVYFKLQRQQGFYILQIYTPCNLIVVMSWVSFWINKEASPARVALGIMTVLSMSTLGFGLRTDLPKVSHSTALDIYIISCFGFVFAALVEYAVINYAHIVYIRKKVHDLRGLESNRAMERMGMFAASLMGATRRETLNEEDLVLASSEKGHWYHRFLCSKPEHKTSVFYRMAVKAAKAKRKLKMNDPARVVNKIDTFSKIVFPSVFVLFNLGYWLAFLYLIPDEIDRLLADF
ncbi:hypothetical protein L596_016955 [Steinernema carpocapsae]|uniref:Neurotransmitter-gated ion-channel ligand-binding domain-containing protein n=1 Tax=Steinernema carpocapsae TaxID=34508 RepID=A0A4U5N0Z7_STECR|nr:hypothetical protein L596_016955 [Steinernema carpocapsae]